MRFFNFLSKSGSSSPSNELPDIFPLALQCQAFVDADVKATYTKILTDTLERTYGLPKEYTPILFDNCVQTEAQHGLISLLVDAMASQTNLFLVYVKAVKVLRKANSEEERQIRADYAKAGESKVGVFISFQNYRRTEMLKIYSTLEYFVLLGLHKNVNIAKAIQIKIKELRSSVALADASVAEDQARAIANALKEGKDVYLDVGDEITSATPDIGPIEKAIDFLDAKRAFYLDLPLSYISGLRGTGLSDTGEADMRAVERGLKQYFFSIIHPVLLALFDIDTEFKTQDFRQIESALETIKSFELVSDTYLSQKSKREIIARMFDVDPQAEEKSIAKESEARGSSVSLNGAQVTAMTGFLAQLGTGSLAPETAIQALMVAFNLTEEDAARIVEPMVGFNGANANATSNGSDELDDEE